MSDNKNIKAVILMPAIRIARKIFRNTSVHRLKLTSDIYKKTFQYIYKDKDIEAQFRGMKLILPTKDTSMVPSIMNQDYEVNELDLFEAILQPGDTVIDIGANLGIYSIIASKAVGSKGKVFALEPVKENINYLKQNLENNTSGNVNLINKAIGKKKAKLKIYMAEKNVGTHSLGIKTDKYQEVDVLSIDEFVADKKIIPNVIKIDIEGYEGLAFEGAKKTLKTIKPIIFMEFSGDLLKKSGYEPSRLFNILKENYKFMYLINERSGKTKKITSINDIPLNSNQNVICASQELSELLN